MSEQPRRRETMGDINAEVWPEATPEMLSKLAEMFGPPEEEVGNIMEHSVTRRRRNGIRRER